MQLLSVTDYKQETCALVSYLGLNVISYPLECLLQSKLVMGILNVTDRNGLSYCGHLQQSQSTCAVNYCGNKDK